MNNSVVSKCLGISEILPVFAARCRGVSPVFIVARIVSSVSSDKFVLRRFGFADSSATNSVEEFTGVNVTGSSQVGHGTISPVPSDGYSIGWPQ
jgi:hypothetical protein